jgi:hypothetical protein
MREHRGIANSSTNYGPYVGVCTDSDCQCHFYYGAANRAPCKHFWIGRDREALWFCTDCGQRFSPAVMRANRALAALVDDAARFISGAPADLPAWKQWCADWLARAQAMGCYADESSEFGATMPECMAPDGAQPCAAYTALLNEVVELRKLCALKQREHAKTYLQREPDKGRLASPARGINTESHPWRK